MLVLTDWLTISRSLKTLLTEGTESVTAECYESATCFGQRSHFQGDRLRLIFYSHTYWGTLLAYLLTSWGRVLIEKLTGSELVKKFPSFYGTRRFITAFTNARHLSLSWASSIQSIPNIPLPEDTSSYYPSIYAWVSQVVPFPQVSPLKPCVRLSSHPYALHAHPHPIHLDINVCKHTFI